MPNEVKVLAQLQWRGLEQGVAVRGTTRGFLGDVLLSRVDVITGLVKDPAVDFVASQVVKRVDAQVDDGVYQLKPESLNKLRVSPRSRVHGRRSSAQLARSADGLAERAKRQLAGVQLTGPQRCPT